MPKDVESIFEELNISDILAMSNAAGSGFSSTQLEAAIEKLAEWKSRAAPFCTITPRIM